MNKFEQDDEITTGESSDSVWTSNSDLFMAIAVVFLIMFVFSLLASGVQTAQNSIAEKEREQYESAQVPESVKQQNQKDQDELSKSMEEIKKNHENLKISAQSIATMQKTLASQMEVIERVKKDQNKKSLMIEQAGAKLVEHKEQIKNLQQDVDQKDKKLKKIEKMEQSQRLLAEQATKEIQKKEEQLKKLNQQIAEQQQQVKNLQAEVKNFREANIVMADRDMKTQKQIQSSQKIIEALKTDIQGQHVEMDSREHANKKLQSQLNQMSKTIEGLESGLAESQQKSESMGQKLAAAQAQVKAQSGQISNLQGQLKGQGDKLSAAQGESAARGKAISDLEGQLQGAEGKLKAMGKRVTEVLGQKVSVEREHRGLMAQIREKDYEINKMRNERGNIAKRIATRIESEGIEIAIDEKTGTITLKMDEAFYFKNASYELAQSAKEKMATLIPAYAAALFEDQSVVDRISSVSITGFASPTFRRSFVDPEENDTEAYRYNMELSMKRSQQIAEFMFGGEIGSYPHKSTLKRLTRVSGMGYMKPIVADNQNDTTCGIYDCTKSRRVEINFHLNDTFNAVTPLSNIGH